MRATMITTIALAMVLGACKKECKMCAKLDQYNEAEDPSYWEQLCGKELRDKEGTTEVGEFHKQSKIQPLDTLAYHWHCWEE